MLPLISLLLADPVCLPGQELVAPAACCWPGQRWEAACVGVPSCPEGWEPDGAACRSRARIVGATDPASGAGVNAVVSVEAARRLTGGAPATSEAPALRRTLRGVDVSLGMPIVLGPLEPAALLAVLGEELGTIAKCAPSNPDGALLLRMVLDPWGHVHTASDKSPAPGGGAFSSCVTTHAMDWVFPNPDQSIVVITVPVQYHRGS